MKKVIINSLSIRNFKGLKDVFLDFGRETDILGANGTGKTTVYDAWLWLMTGRDSFGRTDFEIKPLENGKPIAKIEHSVKCCLSIYDEVFTIEKTLSETWETKRGETEERFKGNTTTYTINGVPMTERDFTAKLSKLMNIVDVKVLFNVSGFTALNWKDQRSVLFGITGVSEQSVLSEFEELTEMLGSKNVEELSKEVKASKAKAKELLKAIPARIDEVVKSKPEAFDYGALELEKAAVSKKLFDIDDIMTSKSKATETFRREAAEQQRKLSQFRAKLDENVRSYKNNIQNEIDAEKRKLRQYEDVLTNVANSISNIQNEILKVDAKIEEREGGIKDLRANFAIINNKVFTIDENALICPTCGREVENTEEKIRELEENFNLRKSNRLQEINEVGVEFKNEIEELKTQKEKLSQDILNKNISKNQANANIVNAQKELKIKESIADRQVEDEDFYKEAIEQISQMEFVEVETEDTTELLENKRKYTAELDEVKAKLKTKEDIKKADKRVLELEEESKNLSQAIAQLERTEDLVSAFNKKKIEAIEEGVNRHFDKVRFRLFDYTIEGKEVDCCVAMIDGVPITDLNNASKIKANMEISSVIGKAYGLSLPIFIDNAEAVNEFNKIENQIIKLIVTNNISLVVKHK